MEEKTFDRETVLELIDDAMNKGDRSVSIYVGKHGMSINVYPYEPGLQKWIHDEEHHCYVCPNCGCIEHDQSFYCRGCGEQLKAC